jgi:hypothetical protein
MQYQVKRVSPIAAQRFAGANMANVCRVLLQHACDWCSLVSLSYLGQDKVEHDLLQRTLVFSELLSITDTAAGPYDCMRTQQPLSTNCYVSPFRLKHLIFRRFSQNCEKRLLSLSCLSLCLSFRLRLSVCLSAWNNSAPTERIFMKFDIWVFFESLSRKFKFH